MIPNAQYVVAQQEFLVFDFFEECARDIAHVKNALGSSNVVEYLGTTQQARVHTLPDIVQKLIRLAGQHACRVILACVLPATVVAGQNPATPAAYTLQEPAAVKSSPMPSVRSHADPEAQARATAFAERMSRALWEDNDIELRHDDQSFVRIARSLRVGSSGPGERFSAGIRR